MATIIIVKDPNDPPYSISSGAADDAILRIIARNTDKVAKMMTSKPVHPEWVKEELKKREDQALWDKLVEKAKNFELEGWTVEETLTQKQVDNVHSYIADKWGIGGQADCPECYGTTFTNGIGGPCSKGCA